MRYVYRLALLVSLLVLLPALAAPDDKGKTPDDATIRSKLLAGAYIQGKLTQLDVTGDDKTFSLQHGYTIKKTNPEAQKKVTALTQKYYDAMKRKDTKGAKKLADQVQEAKQAVVTIEELPINFDLKADKGLIIRTLIAPVDDDNKPKKLTPQEQKELKGNNPSLPGYIAKAEDLEEGKVVRVYVDKAKLKEMTSAKPEPKDKEKTKSDGDAKDKDKDSAKTEAEPIVYPIQMIVIVPPPTPSTAAAGKAGKNPLAK